jgi:hypothetical protein
MSESKLYAVKYDTTYMSMRAIVPPDHLSLDEGKTTLCGRRSRNHTKVQAWTGKDPLKIGNTEGWFCQSCLKALENRRKKGAEQ